MRKNTLSVAQLRILRALAAEELRHPARTPGINIAELQHLRNQLETIIAETEHGVSVTTVVMR